jgi:hypothetical protein
VDLYGPDGLVTAPSVQGITVAPGAQEVRLLDAVAPGTAPLGLHVTARQGRISVALRDEKIDGLVPRGFDWSAPVSAPSLATLVPGVPAAPGTRVLTVLNPGSSDAIVRLTVIGTQGSFTPSGLDVVDVPGESVAAIPVDRLVATGAVALRLTSDQAVTAAVVDQVAASGVRPGELAFSGATVPVLDGQPAVLPSLGLGPGRTARLFLAAPSGAATLDLVPLRATGPGAPVPVVVADGALVQIDARTLSAAGDLGIAVVLRPGSHPVHVSALVQETTPLGTELTVVPVEPGLQLLTVPALRPALPGR